MKTLFLSISLAACSFVAVAQDTNSTAAKEVKPNPAVKPASTETKPGTGTSTTTNAPAQPMPNRTMRNDQAASRAARAINESIASQTPASDEETKHKTHGFAPRFVRSLKAGNPLQLINPFAPMTKREKEMYGETSRVSYDPKAQGAPRLDFFSTDF